MTSEDDYDYQYSDEEGYSVEGDNDDMDWDSNENPNTPPVQYTKIGMWTRCHRTPQDDSELMHKKNKRI